MDCYKCKFRSNLVGSAHSSCNVIKSTNNENSGLVEMLLSMGQISLTNENTKEPIIILNPHGVKNGWVNWPLDYDPIWVEKCEFFTNKNETTIKNK